MLPQRQIRADYDAKTIVVYQAYPAAIASPAVQAQRFVPPFSYRRMTVTAITDITPQARAIAELARNGQAARARRLLPPERPYPVPEATASRLLIGM
jgi:hypothetical protein